MKIPSPLADTIEALQELPGIGPRSAERLSYYLLRLPSEKIDNIVLNLTRLKTELKICKTCFNYDVEEDCYICRQPDRIKSLIMVVEEPLDVLAMEKTAKYNGVYHVLGGVIDPIRGIGSDEIRVKELLVRLKQILVSPIEPCDVEVIIATNPSTEGETTASYLKEYLSDHLGNGKIKITRLARGLPIGGDLEYADPITLLRALEGRSDY